MDAGVGGQQLNPFKHELHESVLQWCSNTNNENKTTLEAKNGTNCSMLSGISHLLRSLCSHPVMFAGQYGQQTPCGLQGRIFRETYCLVSY